MKKTLKSLALSTLSLLLCFVMLLGTTFAWFTDEIESGKNVIQAGNLDIEMYWTKDLNSGSWINAEDDNAEPVFNYDKWEPGYTEVRYVKIKNAGSLSFKYSLSIIPDGEVSKLADVIDVYFVENPTANIASRAELAALTAKGTLRDAIEGKIPANGILLSKDQSKANFYSGEIVVAIALKMRESAGNEYQNLSIGDTFSLKLSATQYSFETDAFGSDYDENAQWPVLAPGETFTATTTVTPNAEGKVDSDVTVGDTEGDIFAAIPAGVQMADGANALKLTVGALSESESNVTVSHRSEVLRSVDVHIDGVAENNTVPMAITLNAILPSGLNKNNVKLYHVENGATVEMTLVDNPVNHNEFSYDPATGNVVMTIASFSEIVAYGDTEAAWDGETFDYTWYDKDNTELTIANASQFAAFRNIVDGGYYDAEWNWHEVEQDSFKDKTVVLTADINLNKHNFDPIGWGYDNKDWNVGDKEGKVFKGHFDGGNHTIYGLYQDGWDLTNEATGEAYTYTNCGFGLFAAALDATFENLNIDGAYIRVECVETGVLVGLAQGSCTFRNINILGCKAANYQRPVGGVVGEVSPKVVDGVAQEGNASKHTFENVYVDSNTIVGSLWGDFDAPVGGVIGTYWDDAGVTSVDMTNVTVACRLDVYNDVTSTYQWYAYRRAGMLIGNTERADGHTATATYLTCSNVTVYYGAWADYHYCEFNKANPNWPWVRVEPGENNPGYSNPRWGRPIDPVTNAPVTDSVHEHGEGEGHLESIPFHQLYGGGQGVYGAESHPGVSEGIYTVTYIDRDEVLHVDYVTDNTKAYDCSHVDGTGIWPITEVKDANNNSPSYWVKSDNSRFEGVNAGNTANVIVYPKWPNEYTVRCLDTYGNVAYYAFVTDDNTTDAEYQSIANDINNALANIQNEVDKDKKVMIIVWEKADGTTTTAVTANDIKNSVKAKKDFIIAAVPQLQKTSITLVPIYDEITNELLAYGVSEVAQGDDNTSVVIPDYVGKIPVTKIQDGAAEGFDKLHAVTIPDTIENIGNNAFADAPSYIPVIGALSKLETQTFYYDGDPAKFNEQLQKHLDNGESEMFSRLWDSGLGEGSRIFFLKEGKVDPDAGYWQLTKADITRGGSWPSYKVASEEYEWTYYESVSSDFTNEYTGNCDCDCGTRPDEEYWTGVFN